jgi:hypothetical protein
MELDPDVLQFALDLKSQKKKKRIKLAPVLKAAAEEEECQLNYINCWSERLPCEMITRSL